MWQLEQYLQGNLVTTQGCEVNGSATARGPLVNVWVARQDQLEDLGVRRSRARVTQSCQVGVSDLMVYGEALI